MRTDQLGVSFPPVQAEPEPAAGEEGIACDFPALLGMGFYSLSEEGGAHPVARDQVRRDPLLQTDMVFGFASDRRSLLEKLRVSANASFKAFGGKASISVDFARSFQQSSTSVYITASKFVPRHRFTLIEPRLTTEAERFLQFGDAEFVNRFGDCFVSSVDVGGFCHLVFTLDLASEREAQELRVNWSGKWGSFKTAGSISSDFINNLENVRYSLSVQAAGAADAAPSRVVEDDKAAKAYVEELVAYFDGFEERVDGTFTKDESGAPKATNKSGEPVVLGYQTSRIERAVGQPFDTCGELRIGERQTQLDKLAARKDVIEKELSDVAMARLAAVQSGRVADVDLAEDRLRLALDDIEADARSLMSPRGALVQVTTESVERLPDTLRPSQWPVVGFGTQKNNPPAAFCWLLESYRGGPLMVRVDGQLDNASEASVVCVVNNGSKVELTEIAVVEQDPNLPFSVIFFFDLDEHDGQIFVHVTVESPDGSGGTHATNVTARAPRSQLRQLPAPTQRRTSEERLSDVLDRFSQGVANAADLVPAATETESAT